MSDNIWDDPDVKPDNDFVKFENIGDKVVGTIRSVSKHTFPDGKVAAKLVIREDDGNERTLTAGQVGLKAKLAELRPGIGDRIGIVFTSIEKREAGRTLKHFSVDVRPAGAEAPAPPAAASVAAPSASELI